VAIPKGPDIPNSDLCYSSQVVWFVSYVISPETDTLTQKPLAKWTMDEVCQWLQELGPWADEELVPYFRHHGIGMLVLRQRKNWCLT